MSFPRYPKYKDSGVEWLGEVPEHWETAQFRHFVDIENGSDHKHIEQYEGYPVYGSGGIFAYASDYLYDGESVLLGRKGTIDKPLHVTGSFWTVDTMYWTKIKPDTSGRYAFYSATTFPFNYYSTSTALPSMTKGALNGHRVARPPLPEQTAIAAFLDRETAKIDGLVAEQRRLMELLKEKRQAVISHAVTKGLNPDVPMKPSGIEWLGDVPEHWGTRTIARISTKITNGYVGPTRDILVEEGVPYIQATHIKRGRVNFNGGYFVTQQWCDAHAKSILAEGDVLIVQTGAGTGDVGLVSKAEVGFNCHALIIIACDKGLLSGKFLAAVLQSEYGRQKLESIQTGGMHPHLNCGNVKFVEVPVPPQPEQSEVVLCIRDACETFDTLTAEAQRAIDLLQERRTALISAAVTGQIDVRQLAGEVAA